MPDYDYICPECGPFTATRPMAEFDQPAPCRGCGQVAPRAILVAPAFAGMNAARRAALDVNERSANAPRSAHRAGCACCVSSGGRRAEAVPPRPSGGRPWMLGH